MTIKMQRARMVYIPLPKGAKASLGSRYWGIERSHITTRGNEICVHRLPTKQKVRAIVNSKY